MKKSFWLLLGLAPAVFSQQKVAIATSEITRIETELASDKWKDVPFFHRELH